MKTKYEVHCNICNWTKIVEDFDQAFDLCEDHHEENGNLCRPRMYPLTVHNRKGEKVDRYYKIRSSSSRI